MWARRTKLLTVLRSVTGGRSGGAAAVHSGPGPFFAAIPAPAGHGALCVPRRRSCVLQRICPHSTVFWDYHTPSSDVAASNSEWERRAEDLAEFNINVLVNLLRQENGKDLCVIRIPQEMKYVEYFVIVGGTSTRHLKALAQYTLKVYKYLKKDVESHVCIEGQDTDDWMCIDFGNIVVHFMLPETREAYELEKLWTLRSHDDQLLQMVPEVLPSDFTFGFQKTD
ncbi:PREDICTED: mitochondrial assembly of ribosomal large subunit protein 1 [Nanorana parkeri]|uniref:mitochondrial assembly of ribosomal large subunit protein 1 n=1 Tax=Nanorana parkeri TaxID=125878 RepID=UPI000854E385|nr:PREDICTED: mitochondrial assembly of ribosomal large subunit protein 1 [Nanorana parkeri]